MGEGRLDRAITVITDRVTFSGEIEEQVKKHKKAEGVD